MSIAPLPAFNRSASDATWRGPGRRRSGRVGDRIRGRHRTACSPTTRRNVMVAQRDKEHVMAHLLVRRDVDAVDRLDAERVELGRALAARDDHVRALRDELLRDRKSEPAISTRHHHALAFAVSRGSEEESRGARWWSDEVTRWRAASGAHSASSERATRLAVTRRTRPQPHSARAAADDDGEQARRRGRRRRRAAALRRLSDGSPTALRRLSDDNKRRTRKIETMRSGTHTRTYL